MGLRRECHARSGWARYAKIPDSIDHHRQELGGQPIPVLTAVLGIGRRLAESLLPVDPPEAEEE